MSDPLQRVWLILAEVRILAENPAGLSVGSEAVVQCFVPETTIEAALTETDRLLGEEGMRRTDTLKCVRFEGEMENYDVPDFVKSDINEARASRKGVTGTFFTNKDTASLESENREIE